MQINLIVALIALIGVLASALVQYRLGRYGEKNKKHIDIRFQSYVDLINSVAEIASSAKHNKQRSLEQSQALTSAKTRVILVGSNKVVLEIHNFFSNYSFLDSSESHIAFSQVVAAMRGDISGEMLVNLNVLKEALFGKN